MDDTATEIAKLNAQDSVKPYKVTFQKGEKIGIKKGEQQAIQKIIHTMSINLSNEEIAELLQIPVKDVELSMED